MSNTCNYLVGIVDHDIDSTIGEMIVACIMDFKYYV